VAAHIAAHTSTPSLGLCISPAHGTQDANKQNEKKKKERMEQEEEKKAKEANAPVQAGACCMQLKDPSVVLPMSLLVQHATGSVLCIANHWMTTTHQGVC
jgi:hypothetical protein